MRRGKAGFRLCVFLIKLGGDSGNQHISKHPNDVNIMWPQSFLIFMERIINILEQCTAH